MDFYENETESIEEPERLILKRIFKVEYELNNYLVVELDFRISLDYRVYVVVSEETERILGYFGKSWA